MKNKLFSIKRLVILVFSMILFCSVITSIGNIDEAYADSGVTWYKFDTESAIRADGDERTEFNSGEIIYSSTKLTVCLYNGIPGVKLEKNRSEDLDNPDYELQYYIVPIPTADRYMIKAISVAGSTVHFDGFDDHITPKSFS